jgi:putative transposase
MPADLEIHIVLDNYATHKHPRVKAWLAARPALAPPLRPDL